MPTNIFRGESFFVHNFQKPKNHCSAGDHKTQVFVLSSCVPLLLLWYFIIKLLAMLDYNTFLLQPDLILIKLHLKYVFYEQLDVGSFNSLFWTVFLVFSVHWCLSYVLFCWSFNLPSSFWFCSPLWLFSSFPSS